MVPKELYILFVAAFIIKLLSGLFLNAYNGPEVFEYETIANNILNGKGFLFEFDGVEYRAYYQPFYPIFTAIIYYLTNHSQFAMLMMQCIVSSALCFIIYSIAIRLTGRKHALLAATLTAFHPGITIYSILKLHSLVFDILFHLLTVSVILRFVQKPNYKNAILSGCLMGLAFLSRSSILAFVIFGLICAWFVLQGIKIKQKLIYVFIMCIFAIIIYSPWIIRNYVVFNDFVFMRTSLGGPLWVGNNKAASGSAILVSGESIHTAMPQEMYKGLQKLDELGQAGCYKNHFLNFIKEEPLLFVRLFIKKFYYFWWFSPQTGAWYSRWWFYIYKLYYTPLLFLFITGLISTLRDKSKFSAVVIVLAYMLSLAFLHAVVYVDTRHRWVVEPTMIIFASIGFFNIVSFLKNSLTPRLIKS